jgi:uncharacterized protein (DUF697 family)
MKKTGKFVKGVVRFLARVMVAGALVYGFSIGILPPTVPFIGGAIAAVLLVGFIFK